MAHSANQGQPGSEEEVNLAQTEQPAPASYHEPVERFVVEGTVGLDGVGLRTEVRTNGKGTMQRVAEYLALCLGTAAFTALAAVLCHHEQQPAWITGTASVAAAIATFATGVWFFSPARSAPRIPTSPQYRRKTP